MKRWQCAIVLAATLAAASLISTDALAKRKHRTGAIDANANSALVTVPTAAGIQITVSRQFEPKITAFIADLVARGYKPKQIRCAARGGHVPGSRHYSGNACDFDQHHFGRTAGPMYHVAALASAHGLRDGGSFRDWGHIDDGQPLARHRHRRNGETMIASARGHYQVQVTMPPAQDFMR